METLIQTTFQRYLGARDYGRSRSQVVDLRLSIRRLAEQFRSKFRSRAGRLWAAQKLDIILWELLRDELKETGADVSKLFEAIEATKARSLLDQMEGSFQDLSNVYLVSQVINMERQTLTFNPAFKDRTADMIKDLMPEYNLKDIPELGLTSLLPIGDRYDKAKKEQMIDILENLYAAYKAGFQGTGQIISLSQVMKSLQPDEAFIVYCLTSLIRLPAQQLWILVVTSKKSQLLPKGLPSLGMAGRLGVAGDLPVDVSPLSHLIRRLRKAIQNGDDSTAYSHLESLFRLLISPLLENGLRPQDFHRWIIVPHGPLHSIPFSALSDSGRHHLIEDVALTIVPSGSVWFRLQARQPEPVRRFLGFAINLPPLIEAERELIQISTGLKNLQNTVYMGRNATEVALRKHIAGKDIIHITTHGEFPQEDAIDFHRILLSPTAEHDGRIHAEDLRRMDLRSARLVVLSICNGGLYRFGPGDELYGLIPALLIAGAENVLATLWDLEDKIGRTFMIEFYKYLLQYGPAESLRRVSKQFIQDNALLRHWGSFVLVGSSRPLYY